MLCDSSPLWHGRNALTFGRGTTCSLGIILPLGGTEGHNKLESFNELRDY